MLARDQARCCRMTFNHHFWSDYFRREFVPQLRAIVDALEKRLLPAFAGIEEEAEAVSQQAWDAFMSSPATGDEDPADFAEDAEIGRASCRERV